MCQLGGDNLNKQDIALKFPDKIAKWKRKAKKADREKDRGERIARVLEREEKK